MFGWLLRGVGCAFYLLRVVVSSVAVVDVDVSVVVVGVALTRCRFLEHVRALMSGAGQVDDERTNEQNERADGTSGGRRGRARWQLGRDEPEELALAVPMTTVG